MRSITYAVVANDSPSAAKVASDRAKNDGYAVKQDRIGIFLHSKLGSDNLYQISFEIEDRLMEL